jgi:DNA-directed RNA polymerase specialized sigma24 family protein
VEDADLVIEARAGSAAAFTNIFDRHAGRVHDFALAALRDRELALEVVQATFVTASQRLHGLDDPNRLGVWLLAIARHESALRAGPVAGPDRQPNLPIEDPERAELARLVWEGVAGLPLRDRAQLDLDLRQGLDGQDLADALGVSLTQAYDLQGRMRDRTEKALSGYVIARTGVERSPALQKELKGWDGQLTPTVARRIANVVDSDRACNQLRFTLPSVFALYASALPAPFPAVVRSRVLDGLFLPVPGFDGVVTLPEGAEPWLATGFPPPSFVVTEERTTSRGMVIGIAAILLAVVLIGGLLFLLLNKKDDTNLATGTSTTLSTVVLAPTSTIFVATTSTLPGGSIPVATTGTTPIAPTAPTAPGTTTPGTTVPGGTTTTVAGAASVAATPATMDFGTDSTAQQATLTNTGGTAATFTTTTGGSAITASPASGTVPAKGSIKVNINIDRSRLPEGPINTQVSFNTTVGNKIINVRGTVRRPPTIATSVVYDVGGGNKCTTTRWRIQAVFSDESGIDSATVRLDILGNSNRTMHLVSGKTYVSDDDFSPSSDTIGYSVRGNDQWGAVGQTATTTPPC